MNESIKTFSLIVITLCVFVMTIIDILELVDKKHVETGITTAASGNNLNAVAEPKSSVADADQPKTTISFDESKFDFGTITEGDIEHHTFSFTNTGSNPLLITNAIGSCGCTVPTYPREPIAPGGKGSIEVQFNSSGKAGEQNKTVTISANTDPPPMVLAIHASVEEKK